MSFTTRYGKLNAEQKQAVDTIDGPVMVVAGPGTGKTELLSVRVANILQKTDTLPENILCLTFTESGQAAMRERLVGIIGKDAYKVAIHTFHSFGSEIMATNREFFYRNAVFQPADELKQYEILRGIFESLDSSNPLSSMMNGEFTHLRDTQSVISELKRRSALTSDELRAVLEQNEAAIDKAEQLIAPALEPRIDKSTAGKLAALAPELHEFARSTESLYQITPLAQLLSESVASLLIATEEHPTKPITAWKNHWFERDATKKLVLKDRKRVEKLKAVAYIYYEYLRQMEAESLFDFDDMIMQVVHAMEVNPDLTLNLQEKYLYMMVDEFQDTNPAQLRILQALTDNPVNEGEPNLLVVGDDDQAIYGFQGADSSTILHFSELYPTSKLIVLTQNYRSGAPILASARQVITQAGDRLEQRLPALDKQLHAQDERASVELWQASDTASEYHAIADAIGQRIAYGERAASIAVLARRHADIQALLPFLNHRNIPVRYERQESVLESPPIKALTQVAELIVGIAQGKHDQVETMLPEVLSHPAWEVSPSDLWRLSLDAYRGRQSWLETMATTPRFVAIYNWLLQQAALSAHEALEPMIDRLIGPYETPEEDRGEEPILSTNPYYRYFFSAEILQSTPTAYLDHVSALRALRARLREYNPSTGLQLQDLLRFVELHTRLNIPILSLQHTATRDSDAVNLLTAHKSKGLEFPVVYVINSIDSAWGASARSLSRSISYPENLPLQSGGNSADERIRLYYVAMTRAERTLILSSSARSETGKQTLLADFLVATDLEPTTLKTSDEKANLEQAELAWYQPLVTPNESLQQLLAPQLESFKLSATSLNSFLDVTRGGPQAFLLNNLLHFPQAKTAAASYGTVIHWTLQQAHTHLLATGEQKPLEDVLHDFETALTKARLTEKETEEYLQKGSRDLAAFINSGVLPFTATQKSEVNFSNQAVMVGDARLTGMLDLLEIDREARELQVIDYKTGTPAESWQRGSVYTKIKLHKYQQQLLFYKLLAERSAEYGNYTVTEGCVAFIEPSASGESIALRLPLEKEATERTARLIEAVWDHIMRLDLPDTSQYSQDAAGILAFEQDLIDGNV